MTEDIMYRNISEGAYPLVYKEWTLNRNDHQEKYVIQDLPLEDDDLALQLMLQCFVRDEPTCKSLNAISDKQAGREMEIFWRQKLAMRSSLACYSLCPRGTKTLVGLNVCYASDKHAEQQDILPTLKSASWRQILGTLSLMESMFSPYEALRVERYLSAAGLVVSEHARGRGIAVQLIRAREALCKVLCLSASATVFTASTSQHVATKCGFRVLGEMPYQNLLQYGWHYPNIDTTSVKIMGRRY